MALKFNDNQIATLQFNGSDIHTLKRDGTIVWEKPFTYTTGTLPYGVASITCTRNATYEPTAGTGTISTGGAIFYDDVLVISGTASAGFNDPTGSTISAVSENITGANYITPGSRKIYNIDVNVGTGVAYIEFTRDQGQSYETYTSSTQVQATYGDKIDWYAAAKSGYVLDANVPTASNPKLVTITGDTAFNATASPSQRLVAPDISFTVKGKVNLSCTITNSSIPSGILYYKFWDSSESEPSTYSSTTNTTAMNSWLLFSGTTCYAKAYVVNTLGTSSVSYDSYTY